MNWMCENPYCAQSFANVIFETQSKWDTTNSYGVRYFAVIWAHIIVIIYPSHPPIWTVWRYRVSPSLYLSIRLSIFVVSCNIIIIIITAPVTSKIISGRMKVVACLLLINSIPFTIHVYVPPTLPPRSSLPAVSYNRSHYEGPEAYRPWLRNQGTFQGERRIGNSNKASGDAWFKNWRYFLGNISHNIGLRSHYLNSFLFFVFFSNWNKQLGIFFKFTLKL